jgi:hypothetical protein
MLQVSNNAIYETPSTNMLTAACTYTDYTYTLPYSNDITSNAIYWNNYPVYVCTDKTKKAIDVLKALQEEKLLECKSVPKFIALVEKIAGLL